MSPNLQALNLTALDAELAAAQRRVQLAQEEVAVIEREIARRDALQAAAVAKREAEWRAARA